MYLLNRGSSSGDHNSPRGPHIHKENQAMHLLKQVVFFGSLICFAGPSATALWATECTDATIQQSQKQAAVAAAEYSTEIQLARQAALGIYEHGMLGNSGSAINNKIGRPPGMSVAVAVDGKLVWAEGFGLADLEQCVPATPKTKFRIGSTSKPLTSAAAALLYEQGRIDLDAPIQRYVPSFPDKGQVITTRELLGHIGGIRHYNAAEEIENQKQYSSVTESLARFKDDPLIAPPGTKRRYSTYGYVLVSAVIEGASGQDFLTFMHDRVFLPLACERLSCSSLSSSIQRSRTNWSFCSILVKATPIPAFGPA